MVNTDPDLGPLEDNGGPTFTYVPRPGSKLINGGDASICQGEDQRGVSIPFGVGCDIGAVESTATLMSLENLIKNLQINSGSDPDFEFNLDDDVNSDQRFGMAEALYVLSHSN